MQLVVPCGGLATRLGKLAENTPKAMMKINDKPFLEHQINLIRPYQFDEILLLIGHLGNQIESYFKDGFEFGIDIIYSHDNHLGVVGALKNAETLLRNQFFLMYGDSYLPSLNFDDMSEAYQKQNKMAMMSIWKNNDEIEPSNVTVRDGNIVNIGGEQAEYIDYGAIVCSKKILDFVSKGKKWSTATLWKTLVDNRELSMYEVDDRFYDIGKPERLEEVRSLLSRRK